MSNRHDPVESPTPIRSDPTAAVSGCGCGEGAERLEKTTLTTLLVINGLMFLIEACAGWWGDSTGLLADSLDMFADASVYGIALYAVGRSTTLQSNAATASGWIQIALGAGVLIEVIRRILIGSEPVSTAMILIGALAMFANIVCLILLAKHRTGGVHMRASWIFSTNDVIANAGVIVSGLLVMMLGSRIPDLIIGSIVSTIVVRGGIRILHEAQRRETESTSSTFH